MFIYIFKTSTEYENNKNRIFLFFLNQTNGRSWKILERKEAVVNLLAKFLYINIDDTLKYIKENLVKT